MKKGRAHFAGGAIHEKQIAADCAAELAIESLFLFKGIDFPTIKVVCLFILFALQGASPAAATDLTVVEASKVAKTYRCVLGSTL
jgi:hypothetical protein